MNFFITGFYEERLKGLGGILKFLKGFIRKQVTVYGLQKHVRRITEKGTRLLNFKLEKELKEKQLVKVSEFILVNI